MDPVDSENRAPEPPKPLGVPLLCMARSANYVLTQAALRVQAFRRDPHLQGDDFADDDALIMALQTHQDLITASVALLDNATAVIRLRAPSIDLSDAEAALEAANAAGLAVDAMRQSIVSCDLLDDGDAASVRIVCADTWGLEAEDALAVALGHLGRLLTYDTLPLRPNLH